MSIIVQRRKATHKRTVALARGSLAAALALGLLGSFDLPRAQAPLLSEPPPVSPLSATLPGLRADQITLLRQTLSAVANDGFRPNEFTPPGIDELLDSDDVADRDRGAAMLETAILSYARAQHGLRLSTGLFDKNWGMRPGPYDALGEFNVALAQDRLAPWLDTLPPPFDRYRGLKDALAEYRAIAAKGGWSALSFDAAPLGSASRGLRVTALRRRLAAEYPQTNLDTTSATFDSALTEAVQTYQHNVGLVQTGIVDKATLLALNVTTQERIAQIRANMERWRWAPRIWPATRIEANIAAQEMDVFQDNALVLEMRAAPGRPDDQTPILSSQVESIVFDPPWNVPSSISTKELWPKEAAHPGYLASHGYRVISTGDNGGRRIQQKFGPKSALGKMKFDFPNTYAVYLHDTPSRAAFSRTSRAVSHGCVRLQRPKELADLLLQTNPDWPTDRIGEVIAAGNTIRAPLTSPIPIFLLYWTAFLDVKGRVNFRDDVYGWDTQLMGLIAAGTA